MVLFKVCLFFPIWLVSVLCVLDHKSWDWTKIHVQLIRFIKEVWTFLPSTNKDTRKGINSSVSVIYFLKFLWKNADLRWNIRVLLSHRILSAKICLLLSPIVRCPLKLLRTNYFPSSFEYDQCYFQSLWQLNPLPPPKYPLVASLMFL
jgi:hypothetical protein